MNIEAKEKQNLVWILGLFKNSNLLCQDDLCIIKHPKTRENNGKVPVHKNQKQVILKNKSQPNLEEKL